MHLVTRQAAATDPWYADFTSLGLKSNIAVFDFETSGLDPKEDRPIEAALIRITPDGHYTEFSTLIHYPKFLSAKITEITGITNVMLAGQPDYEVAMEALYKHMGLCVLGKDSNTWLVGHNILKFDMEFLRQFTMVKYRKPADLKYWDTAGHYKAAALNLVREPKESFHSYHMRALNTRAKGLYFKLTLCCDQFGIPTAGAHRALDDVKMTLALFLKQCLQMKQQRTVA